MTTPVYLDYAATTPCDPRVADVLMKHLTMDGVFANPASRSHIYGWQAEAAVEKARKQVATLLNADVREIVWTSGATEANNLAIKGAVLSNASKGRHIISSAAEHKAVLDSLQFVQAEGYQVTLLKPGASGAVSPEQVTEAIRPDTALISLMHVNNETGAISDVQEIANLAQQHGILMHIDAAQSAGKIPLDVQQIKADMVSVCAHKVYGPKGIGALFVRRKPDFILPAQIHGGGHERGMRSGTLATHQIAAMGEAFDIARQSQAEEFQHLIRLKTAFLGRVLEHPCVQLNGALETSVPGIVNLTFKGIDGQVLLSALPMLAVSSGSACNSATVSPSHVLTAMGVPQTEALSALRFSFGRFTNETQVNFAAESLLNVLNKLAPAV